MYSNIVVGAHKSETARRAVDEATQLARALDAHLHLVSAYHKDSGPIDGKDTPGRADAQRAMDAMVPAARAQKVTTHALPGDPAKAILTRTPWGCHRPSRRRLGHPTSPQPLYRAQRVPLGPPVPHP